MNPIGIPNGLIMLAILVPVLACTWVPLTNEGSGVRILKASEAADCEKIAETTSKTSNRIVIFARSDRKVREELDSLARNEAAALGGNAIVPIGTATNGRQSFVVYRCENPSLSSKPPNKALQLTPNSADQSIRGSILAAGVSAPALAVSAVWRS